MLPRWRPDDRHSLSSERGEPSADPATMAVGNAIVPFPVAAITSPAFCQRVDDHGVQRRPPAVTAPQPGTPATDLGFGGNVLRSPASIGVSHGSQLSALAAERSVRNTWARPSPWVAGIAPGHSLTSRSSRQMSTQVLQSSASGCLASTTSTSSDGLARPVGSTESHPISGGSRTRFPPEIALLDRTWIARGRNANRP